MTNPDRIRQRHLPTPLVIELRLHVYPPNPVTTLACALRVEEVRDEVGDRLVKAFNVEVTDWYLGERG